MKQRIIEEIDDTPKTPMPPITEEMLERSRQPAKIDREPKDRFKPSQKPVFF